MKVLNIYSLKSINGYELKSLTNIYDTMDTLQNVLYIPQKGKNL